MMQTQFGMHITITPKEQAIFNTILDFRNNTQQKSILRVAGGWVRDKLMGKESHDIDIAIDDMTGEQFVLKMKEYLETKQIKLSGFGVTRLNPQQSKHLETACIKINDELIDFVNLRGETYTEESRTPQICIGTPEQDAFRRDLTINAIFYNLITNEIEDFTKMGIHDLENGIIRTPLAPYETFKDDPLRILRTIRFATRFGFKIDQPILQAIMVPDIRLALDKKVSRERIGIEIDWLLKNEKCNIGLKHYHQLGLWDIIFELPGVQQQCSIKQEEQGKYHLQSYQFLEISNQHRNLIGENNFGLETKEQINQYLNLCSICFPYFQIKYKKGKNLETVIEYIISESLKFPRKITDDILLICKMVDQFNLLKKEDLSQQYPRLVNFLIESKNLWIMIVYLDFLKEYYENPQINFELQNKFITFIYSHNLDQFYLVKPHIDGNEIKNIWKVDGKKIKDIKQNILIWQAENTQGTRDQLLQIIQQNKEHFLKN